MSINIIEKKVKSSDGIHTLVGKVYLPEGEPKAYLHVVHGMEEHIGRYDRFMKVAAENGYICFGYDHLGHGLTAQPTGDFGYIADKDGWLRLCQDVQFFSSAVIAEYGSGLPYYLMGHSMGSFIVRAASEMYVKPDKLIIMGTGGPMALSGVGLCLVKLNKAIYGGKHCSKFVYLTVFGSYNSHFKAENDTRSWLSSIKEERDRNRDDEFCRIKFTIGGMEDLLRLQRFVNRKAWFSALPSELPIFLVAGTDDPVGSYGKGVTRVYNLLKQNNKNATLKLYQGGRHEILNDVCREEVTGDILEFLKK
ncbi:MAG: alpha/beta hydrolase [Oscillospiraceae bacterium]|nr:alpha/beta hydrolase [Oscillospiraceae bacterium]